MCRSRFTTSIVHREGSRGQLTGTLDVDRHRLGAIAIQLGGKLFQVEDDLCNVLFHAGNGGKLMLDALNADAGNGNARQRAQQHATQGISQRLAKAMLKRLYDKLAVAVAGFHTFDAGLFDFYHMLRIPSFFRRRAAPPDSAHQYLEGF